MLQGCSYAHPSLTSNGGWRDLLGLSYASTRGRVRSGVSDRLSVQSPVYDRSSDTEQLDALGAGVAAGAVGPDQVALTGFWAVGVAPASSSLPHPTRGLRGFSLPSGSRGKCYAR